MDLIQVATFARLADAQQAEGLLRSMGIDAFLKNENILRIDPFLACVRGGELCLMVAPADLDRAREILDTTVSDEDLAAQAAAAEPEER